MILKNLTFLCLVFCTILEPVFIRRLIRYGDRILRRKSSIRASKRFSIVGDPLPAGGAQANLDILHSLQSPQLNG